LVDHAAACACPQLHAARPPARRGRTDQQRAHSHANAIAALVQRAGGARGAHEARLAVRCVQGLLDSGGARAAAPMLHLLLGLLDGGGGGGPQQRRRPWAQQQEQQQQQQQQQEQACSAFAAAVVESPMLLEVLQDLYSQTAWHLPMAEMLAKIRGEWLQCVPHHSGLALGLRDAAHWIGLIGFGRGS
jgi:hypothetical protein